MKIESQTRSDYLTVPLTVNEDDIIANALAIIKKRLKTYGISFSDSSIAETYFKTLLATEEREHFHCCWLNNQHQLIEDDRMFTGTVNGSSVYPREVVKRALEVNALAVIFAHNHPSGNTEPSEADRNITTDLKKALDTVNITVLDHIIVGGLETYSFANKGIL